jgi:peptidoglycan/xylan/chitin deacetylase (PgdA/CDA1 family)
MALQVALVALLITVVVPLYMIYKPPVFVINILQRRSPQVLFHVPTSRNVVALTIDDAPSQYTRQILDILQENDASATFFAIGGQVAGREDALQAIVQSGSELGNHAMHDEPSINVPSDRLKDEIEEVDKMIERAYDSAGQNRIMHYFRPGSGIFSERVLEVAKDAGYRTILGSIYPHDPFIPYWRVNAWHILSSLRPGAVIICHDRRSWTVPMLKKVVPEIKRQGYQITTVTGLLDPVYQT